jgi:NAD+ diphosphatase
MQFASVHGAACHEITRSDEEERHGMTATNPASVVVRRVTGAPPGALLSWAMTFERPGAALDNLFAGAYLDRRAEAREAADWLQSARADASTVYVAMSGTQVLMQADAVREPIAVRFLSGTDPRVAQAPAERLVLLGWFRGARCVLLENPADELLPLQADETFAELRPFASRLPELDAGLLAYARALSIWRTSHRHCSRCGQPTSPVRAGHVLRCVACGHESFPRIDPAIIVLVSDGERALLGRQSTWAPGRYSTIAGFVEPGESLEDAVRREVREETGIAVTDCRYHSSQPWPFPASLMLGFHADSPGGTPRAEDSELEDVRWVSREAVHAGEILLPPVESISRRLIEDWLAAGRTR